MMYTRMSTSVFVLPSTGLTVITCPDSHYLPKYTKCECRYSSKKSSMRCASLK